MKSRKRNNSKAVIIVLVFSLIAAEKVSAQNISCSEVFETVVNNYDYKDTASCFGSDMLAKVEYYTLDDMGFVVGYIKRNDYDFTGQPYIFCGISSYQWSRFKSNGMIGSWGESFHEYIIDYKCNCY